MSQTLAARIVAVGGVSTPDRSSPRMFASARDDAVRARLVRANHHRAARVPPRGPRTIVAAALPRDDDDERREISRRRPDGRRDWSGLGSINDHTLPGNLRKIQNAKNEARDGVAATAVMYAFAAWQYLQWPASIPHASLVPAPHIAALVAAAATGLVVPVLAAAAHPGANYGVKWPLLVRAAFGTEAARAMTSARRFVYSTFAAVNFLVCAEALHVLSAVLAPAASVVGHGAWASATCYAAAWLLQSRGLAGYCKTVLVKGGGAFVVATALFAAKHAMFGGEVAAVATKAAATAAAKIAAAAPLTPPSLDIAAGLVGVWVVLAGVVLDAAADDTVGAAVDATRTGRPLRPAKDRAWAVAARLPVASAFAAFAMAVCLNPSVHLPPALRAAIPVAAVLPALNALAGPAATAVLRGTSSAAVSEANVAMLAGIFLVVSMGLPANAIGAANAAFGAGLFAAGASVIAPALGVVMADYFVLRKRVVDTALLVEEGSNKPGGSFWFWNGLNPRAVLAAAVGAAFPICDFASACIAGGVVSMELAAGSAGALVSPGFALARGATLGAAVSSALYIAFNKLAPPTRVGGYTRGVQGGMYARGGSNMGAIAADGGATFVDDVIEQEESDAGALDWVARAPGAAGSEAKGQTWSKPGATGGGGSNDEDPDDDDTDTGTDERMRSRLQRAFEMDTVDPETQYVNREPEPPLDVTLGVSLQSELISQLERREDKLGELKEAKARGEKVPEATMTRVQADVDALRRELDAFSSGGFGYATNASGRLVQKSVEEITRARESMRRTRDDETLNPYLDNVGAWAEVSEASAAVTKLDVAIERLAGAAEVSGKPFDADEMRELQEQRTVWGLRLVSAQIKGIVGLQNAVVDKGGSVDAYGGEKDLAAEMRRLEKLSAEKSALLDRLSETERKGSEASAAAADLRVEVDDLRAQLQGARAASKSEAVRAQEGFRRLLADRQALASELQGAEAARVDAETKAKTEVDRLWSEVQRLQGLLGEKEGDLERIKSELDTSDLPVVRSIEERTAPLEAEIKDLRSEISKLRGEMAQKDVAAGEATELLRAQLRETADALDATEKALADAKTREKSLTEKGTAGDAERARAAQDAAAAARRDSNSLREQLADAQMKLEAKVAESKQKEEAARKSVDDARQIEAESRRAAETAQAQVQEVETAMRAKEKELETALVRAGESDRKQLSLVAVVEELTEQIASAKAKMDEKTREIADLRAFVPGPERQSEFNDALAQLEAKERDLLESKGRIKSLESDLANAESPERGFKLKNLVSRLKLDRNEAAKSAARRADELATKETELIAVRAEIDRVKAELEDMKAFVPGPEQQSEFGAALETIAEKERELLASKDRIDALEAALVDAEKVRDEALESVEAMQRARDEAVAEVEAANDKSKAASADVERVQSLLDDTKEQLERVETDVAAVLEARVVEQSAELAELKAASADADAKRKEAELRARTIEADLAAKVEAAAGDSEEVKALRSKVETFETDVAKLRADVEAKDAELELRSKGLKELARAATDADAKTSRAVKDLKASEKDLKASTKAREVLEQKLADLETATKSQVLVLEKKLQEKAEAVAKMLPEKEQLLRNQAVAGGILSRIAAKLGGTKDQSWTPAKVEERVMVRLNALESQLEDIDRERGEIAELQAKSIADENALAEANARLEASEIEKDDVQAELRKLQAEAEDMRQLVAARDAAAEDLEAQTAKAKATATDAAAELAAVEEKFQAARDALADREAKLADAKAAREEREEALAAANTALEAALVEAKISREERDEAVAKAESKSASLEAEVADLRAHAESLRAELLDATPAKEGFKWKNLVSKLRLDKNESDKALAAKDAQIQSVRAELNRRVEALESGADVASSQAKMLSADLTDIKKQLAEKDAELTLALATADALRESSGMSEKEGFRWKEMVSRLRLDKNEAEKSFTRRAEEIKELQKARSTLERNANAAVAEYESTLATLRAELDEAKRDAIQIVDDKKSKMMERAFKVQEAEIQEALAQINILRSDREIAEQEVETLRAKLAAVESAESPIDEETAARLTLLAGEIADKDAALGELETEVETLTLALGDRQLELEAARGALAAAETAAEASFVSFVSVKSQMTELKSVEAKLAEAQKARTAAETNARSLTEKLAPLEEELTFVQSELAAAAESAGARESELVDRIAELEAQIDAMGEQTDASLSEKMNLAARIEEVSEQYADEKTAAAETKVELTAKVESLTAQIEETRAIAEADAAEQVAAAEREAKAEIETVKSALTRLDEELADAKATAASAIADAESRERTLTRRVAMLTEECEQLRVTVASAAAVEETEGEESYVAKLTGELALAKAELNEMRAAFELVQEVSDEAVAAEQTLLARVEELEAQVEADDDFEFTADSDKMAELEDALAAAKTELAAERSSREDTEAALAENIESLEELDVARRRVTELEAQLAAVESAGPVVDPKTAREMDEMKQMIEWQDEQILRAVDGLDKRDAEAKRAAEDAAAKLSDVRALEKRLDELQKVADRSKMMERAFKVQEEEVKDGLGQINALRSDREIAEQEVETLRAKLADLEASRPAALPTQSVTDTDAIRTKLEAAEAAVAAKQAELERTNADAAAARAEAERRMAAVVQRFSDDLIAKSDELEKRVEAVFASEEKAAAAFAEELARNAAMLGEKDDETAALVAAVNSLEDEADDYREELAVLQVELEVAYAAIDDEIDEYRDEVNELRETLHERESELDDFRRRSETAAALAAVDKSEATDVDAEVEKVEYLRTQIASLETAAKAAAKTLRAAEKERGASEEQLRARIGALESELLTQSAGYEDEIATLTTESTAIAAKLREAERRANDAEESYANAVRVAAEEKEALELEVGRLRLRTSELEEQLAERDDELRARTRDLDAIRRELTDAKAELAAKASALKKAEADALSVRKDVVGDGAVAASSTLSWLIGGMFSDGDVAAGQTPNVPSLELDGPAAWAASNASLSMSARLGMLVDSRKRMLENADTDEERAVIQSELAALTARRDDVARLESEQSEVEERLRAAKEIWMEQERNLRQRIRQLEASAEVAAKAEADAETKSSKSAKKVTDETSAFSDSFTEREAASKESLRILAKEAEAALAKREEELRRLRGEKARALADAADRIARLESDADEAREAVEDARASAERREREAEAAQRVWATLEATLREQIEAYELERRRREEEGDLSDDSASGGGRRGGNKNKGGPKGGPSGGEAAKLRAEVTQLSEALMAKEASLESLKRANAEMTELTRERELASAATASSKPSTPVMDPALQLEIDEARAEAATLREELERKDRELNTQLSREQTLSAAEAKLKSRVTDLTSQLKEASKGYDAELTRMNAELASLQTMLTQREETFEAMQQRLNDAVESESRKRNEEISDARGEMSEMQGALEKMAKDLRAKAAVEAELRETREKIADMELLLDDKESLEREAEELRAELADNSVALEQAVATVAVLADRLAETSSLAGLPPPKELVTGITRQLLDNLTGAKATELEASVEATAAKLVADSASVADRIDAMLASRERDLEVARAKGKSGKLEARIMNEVVEMRSQRDGARALEKEAAEAKLALETLSASVPETEARLNGRIKQLEAELGDARFDLEDERGTTRAEIEYLEAELRDRDAKVRETQAEWESAKAQLEYELESERADRADAAETLLAERDSLRESLDTLQASIESKIENALRLHEERDELQTSLEQEVATLRQTTENAERKLRAAEAAAKAAEAAGANAVAEIEATLRAQLAETEANRIAASESSANELKLAMDSVAKLEARLADRESQLDLERTGAAENAEAKTSALEDEIARLRAESAASSALMDVESSLRDKVTELESTLATREAELGTLRATLSGEALDSEKKAEVLAAEASLVRSQLADVKRRLAEAESALQQKELAAAAAKSAEATLRERLAEAETQRDATAVAATEERDAFEAELKRLEAALVDAEARAEAADVEQKLAADERVAQMEAETKRLRAATADVQARVEAESAASSADRDAKSAQDTLMISTLKRRLGDAESAAEELKRDLTARLSLMTERVGILETELEGKRGDADEIDRLREEIVALEASRADEVEELERRLSQLMASDRKEDEVRSLRVKIDEMAKTMGDTLGEMRQVEDSLRAKLRAAEADAVKGERLDAAREELEQRLADGEATLAAEKARLTAEAETAAAKAEAEAGELRQKLNALKETLESRDVALAEANTTVEALRKANDDLDRRLLGIERDRDAAAIELAPEIVKLRAEASAQAAKLADADEATKLAKEAAAAATARAEEAEAEAESLRWQLLARDELRAATTEVEAKTVLAKAEGAAPESAMGAIRDELRRRLAGLVKDAESREREMASLREEDERMKAKMAETAGAVEKSEREAAADAEVSRLKLEMSTLVGKTKTLEDALAAKENLVAKIQGGIPAPAEEPAKEPDMFEQPEDGEFIAASANAAKLELLLRRRERALVELTRLEADGAVVSPVLQSYRHEITRLDAEAAEARAELAARDEVVLELRGRLDVELNLLARESASIRARLLETPTLNPNPNAVEPEPEQKLVRDTLEKLQTDLGKAEAASTAAFEKLDESIGAAGEIGTGGNKLMPCKFDIEFVTNPGQTVHVVGTWCDWDVKRGLELKWTAGHRWVGTMPLKPGFNYEYKYAVVERVGGVEAGDAPPHWPEYGFTEPACITYEPGEVAMVVWQKGNNKAVALDSNIVNENIAHVYCKDEWIPDPMNSPIQLVGEDGKVVQTVGSTKLLMQCVNRADEALAEARATMDEVMRIASETLGAASMFGRVDDDEDDGIDRV